MSSNSNNAAVFTGQGSQRPGMAQDFCETSEAAKKIFDQASEAIGEDMAELCFTENERLNLTEYTQPAIVTAEIAIYEALKERYNFECAYFAGHSLGEYAALVAAGVIPFGDAVKIVKERGRLMQAAVPEGVGKMAALLLENIESTDFAEITAKAGAEVANFNSAGQIVISGKAEAIGEASKQLAEAHPEMRIIELEVSAPFHSSLMAEIEPGFQSFVEQFLSSMDLSKGAAVLSNFTGKFHTPDDLISNLVRQISGSVRWTDNMRALIDTGASIYEIGPNKVLTKFFSTLDVSVPAIMNERAARKAFEA